MVKIGLDIIEIDRVAKLAGRTPKFLSRLFTDKELQYCMAKKRRWQHIAARFAAKEAVWKAVGAKGALALKDISVGRGPAGAPEVLLKGRRAPHIQLSLTHCKEYAMAVALCSPKK